MLKWNFPVCFKNTWLKKENIREIKRKKNISGPIWPVFPKNIEHQELCTYVRVTFYCIYWGVLLDGILQFSTQRRFNHIKCIPGVTTMLSTKQSPVCVSNWYKFHRIVAKVCYYCLNMVCLNLTIFMSKTLFNVLLFLCIWIVCFHELPLRPNWRFVCQGWVNWALCIKENPMAIAMLCSHNIQKKINKRNWLKNKRLR